MNTCLTGNSNFELKSMPKRPNKNKRDISNRNKLCYRQLPHLGVFLQFPLSIGVAVVDSKMVPFMEMVKLQFLAGVRMS